MVGYYAYIMFDKEDGLGVAVLVSGPGGRSDEEIANYALDLARTALHDHELPCVPPPVQIKIKNVAEYGGTYRIFPENKHMIDAREFTLEAEGEQLILCHDNQRIELEARGHDRFYVNHSDFALFLLRFGRENGKPIEVFHGPDWYTNERYSGPRTFSYPEEWDLYPGHYCTHNPWFINFRAVLRKGKLVLVDPMGDEQPLIPLGEAVFRIGDDECSPERLSFDAIINGRARRANLSNVEFYRHFTP
jgi:hypothetical protein